MDRLKVFLVEDDPWYGEILKHHLSRSEKLEVSLFTTARECIEQLSQHPDLICVDYGLPDMNGDRLLEELLLRDKDLHVIIISGQEDISVAVNLLKVGAKDYFIKNDNTGELLMRAVMNLRENILLKRQVDALKQQLEVNFSIEKTILGRSEAIQKIVRMVDKAAHSSVNICVSGEPGTGKGVLARTIHFNSERKEESFVEFDLTAVNTDQVEQVLFGFDKSAYPDTQFSKHGKLEEAGNGTLYINEVCDLDSVMQGKLLQVIKQGYFYRINGTRRIPLNVRIICSTERDIQDEVYSGRFREDLYFLLYGMSIEMPPLRKRGKDVLIFAKKFIREYAANNKLRKFYLSKEAEDKLLEYHYPGNLRELKNSIELACAICQDNQIMADNIVFHEVSKYTKFSNREKTLREFTAEIIADYLRKYDHDVLLVAKKLDIGKSTIYNMLKSGVLDLN